jgi:hypothetical protein
MPTVKLRRFKVTGRSIDGRVWACYDPDYGTCWCDDESEAWTYSAFAAQKVIEEQRAHNKRVDQDSIIGHLEARYIGEI